MDLAQATEASLMASPQVWGAGSTSAAAGMLSSRPRFSPAIIATSGPISSPPITLTTMRLPPSIGVKTTSAIRMAGRFRVDEPWTMATVPPIPAPLPRKADVTGTMHAEQRFMTGPMPSPFNVP